MLGGMADVTRLLDAVAAGDPRAAAELLPLISGELRKLASVRLAERPGQTLQPTAPVHEAYVRVVSGNQLRDWNGPGHFFAAAAEAMRRILLDRTRHKKTRKAGELTVSLKMRRGLIFARYQAELESLSCE
jgi:RNA polymerase sigma factor (TIGR02999 family)